MKKIIFAVLIGMVLVPTFTSANTCGLQRQRCVQMCGNIGDYARQCIKQCDDAFYYCNTHNY